MSLLPANAEVEVRFATARELAVVYDDSGKAGVVGRIVWLRGKVVAVQGDTALLRAVSARHSDGSISGKYFRVVVQLDPSCTVERRAVSWAGTLGVAAVFIGLMALVVARSLADFPFG